MTDPLISFIEDFEEKYNKRDYLIRIIRYPKLLLEGLKELNNLVGMDELKLKVINTIQRLLIQQHNKQLDTTTFNETKEMNHIVLSGHPGTGKTSVARILCKIIISLNLIKKPPASSSSSSNVEQAWVEEEPPKELPFKILGRENFVGKYVGHTAPLTKETLASCVGHVVFIDEAYKLYNESYSGDSFGMEALTLINEFMSNSPEDTIFIFAGYKDLLKRTIFAVQPGLQRRCEHIFEIKDYNAKELSEIFIRQLTKDGWVVDLTSPMDEASSSSSSQNKRKRKFYKISYDNLEEFFKANQQYFPNMGGDTERLISYAKMAHASTMYAKIQGGKIISNILTLDMLNIGLKTLINAVEDLGSRDKGPPDHWIV